MSTLETSKCSIFYITRYVFQRCNYLYRCAQGGLFTAAVKKYMLSTKLSLDQGHFEKAHSINIKANKYFKGYDKNNSESEDVDIFRNLKCSLDSSSGQVRRALEIAFPKGNKNIMGFSSSIAKMESYLIAAIKPYCSFIDPETGDVAIESLLAVHTLSGIYETKYMQIRAGT